MEETRLSISIWGNNALIPNDPSAIEEMRKKQQSDDAIEPGHACTSV